MTYQTLLFDVRDGIAFVTVNRPDKLNAMNMRMRDELWDVFGAFSDDPDARVLIVRGAGRAFSSGADAAMNL